MQPISASRQILDAIQQAKAGATAFCTNFYPVESRLQNWIAHAELFEEHHPGAVFFFRNDRDFRHFYFCAADVAALGQGMAASPALRAGGIVADIVGNESSLAPLAAAFEQAGFRRYTRLVRLARIGRPETNGEESAVVWAEAADRPAALELIESAFDRYGEQIPTPYEMEAAIASRQMLVVKSEGRLAGLLFFETQGITSTVRFWAVAEDFRGRHIGSSLMRQYFRIHAPVRRFTLWVNSANENALTKYRHYGYAPDSLVDQVFANEMIRQ